ncbi:MAG: hypothetical protein ACYCVB_19385 [Bacilli bacterium]
MKHTFTGIVAASAILGIAAPVYAASPARSGIVYNQRVVSIGSYRAAASGVLGKVGGRDAEYISLRAVVKGLHTLGYGAVWNGSSGRLNITTPAGVILDLQNLNRGQGAVAIQLNGQTVLYAPRVVANDPQAGKKGTYLPIGYLDSAFAHAGLSGAYNGAVWTVARAAAPTVLSRITTYANAPATVGPNDATSLSGVATQDGYPATVYFAPMSASASLTDQSFTYALKASNGGVIQSIDGVSLAVPVSATTLSVDYGGGVYTLRVPGGFSDGAAPTAHTVPTVTVTPGAADSYDPASDTIYQAAPMPATNSAYDPELFSVGVVNTTTGNTVVTAGVGSVRAAETVSVAAGTPSQVANLNPLNGYLAANQSLAVTFTVVDAAGNPVAGASIPIDLTATAGPLWITAVNRVTLQTAIGNAEQPTPIPLFVPAGWTGSGAAVTGPYTSVVMPGLVSDTSVGSSGTSTCTVYTNAQGQVSLTLQNNNAPYYNGTTASTSNVSATAAGTLYIGASGSASGGTFAVTVGGSSPSSGQDGQISYGASAG